MRRGEEHLLLDSRQRILTGVRLGPVPRLLAGIIVKPQSVLIILFGLHLIVSLCVVPPGLLFGSQPIAVIDYALHFSRAVATDQLLSQYGRTWGYNPFFLAGYPAGTVFDVNNHFIELFVWALHRASLPPPTAFNLLVFCAILLAPILMWLTARNFRLTPGQQVIVVILAELLWLTDSNVNLTWRIGVFASAMAMYSLPFSLSCLYRYREQRTGFWFLCFLISGALVSLLHPLSFLFFYVPVALFLLWHARAFDWRFLGALVFFAAIVLLVNWFWILPFLGHTYLKTKSGYHFIGNLRALANDLLGLRDSGLRLLIYVLAGGGLLTWWREGRRELARLVLFVALALSLAGYVAGEWAFFRDLETFRNNLVAAFLLIIPASVCANSALSYLRNKPHQHRWALAGLVLLLGLQLTGRNLLWLFPYVRGDSGRYALHSLGKDEEKVVQWLRGQTDHERRVLVEYWPLGALIPWYTGLQVIGGPYALIWMPHNFVNFTAMGDEVRLFGRDIRQLSRQETRAYLNTYNVGWVVVYTDKSKEFFDPDDSLASVVDAGRYRIYENRARSTFFLSGNGRVRAEYGRLRVSEAAKGELVLKYHWSPTLVSVPPQILLPQTVLDDPVPFIKIPDNRFTEFVICDASRRYG